jgi:hypothetical protein
MSIEPVSRICSMDFLTMIPLRANHIIVIISLCNTGPALLVLWHMVCCLNWSDDGMARVESVQAPRLSVGPFPDAHRLRQHAHFTQAGGFANNYMKQAALTPSRSDANLI